jgi:hypothetical protein
VDWIGLAQDTDKWRALVLSVMNLLAVKWLRNCGLSSSAQLHRGSHLDR